MNVSSSITDIQAAIDSANSSITRDDLLLLTVAITNSTEDRIISVPTIDDLPDAANVANGFMAFVEDIKLPLYAKKNDGWYGIDGRKARSDVTVIERTLWTWGWNINGTLGEGTTTDRITPGTTAGGGTDWFCVEIGFNAVAALKTDGTIWTWGNGDSGKLGNDTLSGNRSSPGTIVGNETNWCYIGRPVDVTHAIKTDGTLWSWGINTFGQLGTSGGSTGSPVQVAGGGNNWIQVYGGGSPSSAVKTDGTLWIWGCTTGCQAMGDGTTQWKSSPVTTVGGGTNWLISGGGGAIKTDGTLWTWGLNDSGRLGDGTTTNRCSPVTTAGGGTNWCQIDLVSSASGFALKTDGTLWAWGSNANGSLGDGTTANRSSPVTTAGGGTNWCQVTFSAAMKTDGTLWTWGCGSVFGFFGGRIGDGNTADRSSPVSIGSGGTSWVQVSSSTVATVALKSV